MNISFLFRLNIPQAGNKSGPPSPVEGPTMTVEELQDVTQYAGKLITLNKIRK